MKLPPYTIFPAITGSNISLREIKEADLNDLIEISFYDAKQATRLQEAIVMQSKINADYLKGNSIHWCITDNTTRKIVGTCGYYRGFENGAGELGCVLLKQYRGKGYMTNALKLAIDFGVHTIGLKHIFAVTTMQNAKAIQLLMNLNFIKVVDLNESEIKFEYKSAGKATQIEIIN